MAEPFLSEIRIMSFGFPTRGWANCDGQFMAINQNQALFSLLGTTFGGDGQTTFALPDLRGRVPIHVGGQGHTLGERGGEAAHTLSISEIPQHTHVMNGVDSPAGVNTATTSTFLAQRSATYGPATNLTPLAASEIGNTGGNQAHLNMQPFLVLNFSIALQGIFPSQN
jgi:microcystin-dependent protein